MSLNEKSQDSGVECNIFASFAFLLSIAKINKKLFFTVPPGMLDHMVSEAASNSLSVNTQNSPFGMTPMSQSPNSLGLATPWNLSSIFPPMQMPSPFPYPSLNHLLTTQQLLQSGLMPPPGLGANFPGFNQMQQLSSGFNQTLNNIKFQSLADVKDSGKLDGVFIYPHFLTTKLINRFLKMSFVLLCFTFNTLRPKLSHC